MLFCINARLPEGRAGLREIVSLSANASSEGVRAEVSGLAGEGISRGSGRLDAGGGRAVKAGRCSGYGVCRQCIILRLPWGELRLA